VSSVASVSLQFITATALIAAPNASYALMDIHRMACPISYFPQPYYPDYSALRSVAGILAKLGYFVSPKKEYPLLDIEVV